MIGEGTYGTLNAFVVTRVAPKVVHLVEHEIPPLSLHRTVCVKNHKIESLFFWQKILQYFVDNTSSYIVSHHHTKR